MALVKHTLLATIVTIFALCFALPGQGTNRLGTEMKAAYNSVKNNLLKSAEKMPDENYGFKPTPDVRSFAEVLDHAAAAQLHSCGAVNGEQKSANTEAVTKADVLALLNSSFAACDKAFDSLTDANASEPIKSPRGERSRVALLAGVIAHDNEQYGILSVYMRLKGVIPPSSEGPAQKK
jgi:uncharacterized damage-inducible protein DinB